MNDRYDVGVIGAGILGLAHAYLLARRGLRVMVFERSSRAQGASVRNFGMIWPIGQPLGPLYQLARRSREIWLEALSESGIWHRPCGSLHLAYHDDEAQVLREFVEQSVGSERDCRLWSASRIGESNPSIVQTGLRLGMWSPHELAVDARYAAGELAAWLEREHGVNFAFGTPVLGYDLPRVFVPGGERFVNRLVICTGSDYQELAPHAYSLSGLFPVKLQMMRSQPLGDAFPPSPHLAGGLTLRHYASFADCPSLADLCRRLDAELPEYGLWGIHVLVSQTMRNELTIGDSHEYGDAIEPFDNPQIDALILGYLKSFLNVPNISIAARWHGIYVKHPTDAYVVARLAPQVRAVTGVGGAGMTLSFGLAEQVVNELLS